MMVTQERYFLLLLADSLYWQMLDSDIQQMIDDNMEMRMAGMEDTVTGMQDLAFDKETGTDSDNLTDLYTW